MDAIDVRGLLGVLLTEGSMTDYSGPQKHYIQLTITAGLKNSAFLEEKADEICYFLSTEAQILPYAAHRSKSGKVSTTMRYRISSDRLRPIYNMLYPNKRRQITRTTLDMLGGHAAGWCWATGAKNNRDGSSVLEKVGQSEEEAELISQWLEMLTGAPSVIGFRTSRPHLEFTVDGGRKIRESLLNYAPRSRKHLFSEDYLDVSSVHSARTELLLGEWDDSPEG